MNYSTVTKKVRFLADVDGYQAGQIVVLLESKADVYIAASQATTTIEAIDKTKVNVVVADEVREVVVLTQAEYDAIGTKDPETDYRIVE